MERPQLLTILPAHLTKVRLVWYHPQRELTRTRKASGCWTEAAMDTQTSGFVRACSLDELKAKGRLVVHG
ncbi:hypothetical protein, partial [Microvirga aerophila]|uniref:hypothetical protein n=1 Tax=Microvirga aerophila TaxID=670291 RepID=UPI0035A24221